MQSDQVLLTVLTLLAAEGMRVDRELHCYGSGPPRKERVA